MFAEDRCDLAPSTIAGYYNVLDRLFTARPSDITRVGRLHILTYLQRFSLWSTYNANLAAIKSFFAWAAELYDFPDPAAKLKAKKQDTIPDSRMISESEYKLIAAYHGYGRDIAVFLANTGLRAEEFLTLRKEHINGRVLTIMGKGRKIRKVPLNESAWQILSKYDYHLNLKKNGNYLSYTNLRYRMEHLAEKLNFEKFGPHSLRHYFATALISRGANIADVSKLLGHATIKLTISTYYHPQSLDCVSLLDNPPPPQSV